MFKTRTRVLYDLLKNVSLDRRKTRSCLSRIREFSSEETSKEAKPFSFENRYTDAEQTLILKTINNSTMDELKGFSITEARIKKLMTHRDKNGIFESLDQVFLLQGIDVSVLDKFCKSITKKNKPSRTRGLNAKGDLLIPPLDEDKRIAINTCTGIWVCANSITWAQLDTSCNLLKWDCHTLGELVMKDGLVAVVDSVARIVSKVPPSHAYIMETDPIIPFARMNSMAYYLQLQRQQIVATIATVLGTRQHRADEIPVNNECDSAIKNVYMMRSRVPARFFDLLIGSEMVSAQEVVRRLLGTDCESDDHKPLFIRAQPETKKFYESRDAFQREQMNWALLLTTTFLNLSIMRSENIKRTGKE